MKKYIKIGIIFSIGLLGGILGTVLTNAVLFQNNPISLPQAKPVTVDTVKYDNVTSTTQAVQKVQDAVVSVINYQNAETSEFSFFNQNGAEEDLVVAGEGSGFIYKKDQNYAYIVTNNHVIAGTEKIDIQFSSGERIEGELVGADTYSDIAVIRIKADKVKAVATFADSDAINVGEVAIAIGSPLGSVYANSVTQGIISSLSRTVTSQSEDGQTMSTNAIQTDTAINPGNSGGPLINIQGQVIGITSSKIVSSSSLNTGVSVEGMGFAIPSNDAVAIINQLEENGKVIRPGLGIHMADVASLSTTQLTKAGLNNSKLTSGVLIISTQAGLPAHGKFEKYDVITAINEQKIETTSDLQSALYKHKIGDTIEITYYRKGKEQKVRIKLTHSTDDLQGR